MSLTVGEAIVAILIGGLALAWILSLFAIGGI